MHGDETSMAEDERRKLDKEVLPNDSIPGRCWTILPAQLCRCAMEVLLGRARSGDIDVSEPLQRYEDGEAWSFPWAPKRSPSPFARTLRS